MKSRRSEAGSKTRRGSVRAKAGPAGAPAPAASEEKKAGVVVLRCDAPNATVVAVAGSFNNWNPEATPLYRQPDGTWAVELYLAPGTYEYRFVVDGCWCDDPAAAEYVPNPFGSYNAVLRVT